MERCPVVEYHGLLRCMNLTGHHGLHWAWDVDAYVTWGEAGGVEGALRSASGRPKYLRERILGERPRPRD